MPSWVDYLTLDRDRGRQRHEAEETPEAETAALPVKRALPVAAPPEGAPATPLKRQVPVSRTDPEVQLPLEQVPEPAVAAVEPSPQRETATEPQPAPEPAEPPGERLARLAAAFAGQRVGSVADWTALLDAAAIAPRSAIDVAAEAIVAAVQRRPVPERRRFLEALGRWERQRQGPLLTALRVGVTRVGPTAPPPGEGAP